MKTRFIALLLATAVSSGFIGCSKSKVSSNGSSGSNANSNSISISGMAFPAKTTVKLGSTVTWTNNDPMAHTVTSDDGVSFDSGSLGQGQSFSYTPANAGTFTYHCNFHANMKATLVVIQ